MKSIAFVLILSLSACHLGSDESDALLTTMDTSDQNKDNRNAKVLDEIWYQGKAEISTFSLKQNRYEDIHPGEVVQIFVTEDFLTGKQVKNDRYVSSNSTGVLKNNRVRRFTTGFYDYSVYTSVFTDLSHDNGIQTLKINTSSQDWCGQSFSQLNFGKDKFRYQSYSYFEVEGDIKTNLPAELSLDEIFNRIRINPSNLPTGNFKILPTLMYTRLKHKPLAVQDATGAITSYKGDLVTGKNLQLYTISIPNLGARYEFIFESGGTHEILAWKEIYPSAFDNQIRETVAVRQHVEWLPYWELNGAEDAAFRQKFDLGSF